MRKSLDELKDLMEELTTAYQTVLDADVPYEKSTVEYAKFRAEDSVRVYKARLQEELSGVVNDQIK